MGLKYTNVNIKKSYRYETVLAAAGALFCLISLLLCVSCAVSVRRAQENIRPMGEVLSEGGNHAAKPVFLEQCEVLIQVAQTKGETYYLIHDGSAYYICGVTAESEQQLASLDKSPWHLRLEGITYVLTDKETKAQIAEALSGCFEKEIRPEALDGVVGDVYLRAGTLTAGAILKGIYILRIVFAAPLLIFGIAFLFGGCSGLAKYGRIACAGNITPQLLDSEANAKDAKWLKHAKIYLTPSLIAGFSNGITTLRYEEIARIYGGQKDPDDPKSNKFLIVAVTADKTEYTLCETPSAGTLDMLLSQELNLIYRECKARHPGIVCEKK